jgi:hypothetical protein
MEALPRQMPLRLPAALHEDLKTAAAAEGLSLNQYCLFLLARHGGDSAAARRQRGEELLKFLAEAQVLQRELEKQKLSGPQREKEPEQTPKQRYKKLHGRP